MLQNSSYFLKIIYLFIYLFICLLTYLLIRERGREAKESERNIDV